MPKPKEVDPSKTKFQKKFGTGLVPDEEDPRDFQYRRVAAASPFLEIPESISLIHLFPKKRWNQRIFGSCTSFTAHHLVAAVREKMGLDYIEPSFMATWYWTKLAMYGPGAANQDLGASIRESVMSTRREGVAPAELFPYVDRNLSQVPGDAVKQEAEKKQSLFFFRIDDIESGKDGLDVEFVYRCLAEGWPVSIALPLYNTFDPEYSTGLIPYPGDGDKLEGYHAMTLYGYNLRGRRPYFKCMNQWGEDWGGRYLIPSGKHVEGGTCRLPIEYVRDFGFDSWTIRAVEDDKVQGVPIERVI